mgnify:CR=1 FL=1
MNNNTKLTKQMYINFLRRHAKVSFIIIRICYSILITLGVLNFIIDLVESNAVDIFFLVYCLGFSLLFILYDIFYVKINMAIVKDKILLDCEYSYIFNNDSFEMIVQKEGKEITKATVSYAILNKVKIYEDAIYVYLNRINAYIIDLNGFTDNEAKSKTIEYLKPYVK